MKLKRTIEEDQREQRAMRDPKWELYKQEGIRLDEILLTKPPLTNMDKCLVWTNSKGWEEVDVKGKVPRNRRPRRRDNK